jgi:ubiquinone/menaquinone biosynthesis C-methylase UbiE
MSDPDTRKYYRARAREYEQIYYREVPERRKEIDDEVARLKKLVKGKSVLDLACGTGYWTKAASETARDITAIDQAPEMIAEARKKDYRSTVTFVEGDMFGYRFDRRFDVIIVGFWFSHQPRQEYDRFFDLLSNLVERGGAVWMIDNNPPAEGPQQNTVGTDEYGNNFKKRYLDDGTEFVILKNYFSEKQLREIIMPHADILRLTYGVYYWSVVTAY